MNFMKFVLFALSLLLWPAAVSAEARVPVDAGWLALGHYRPSRWGDTYVSTIDSENFFLSKQGKTSPEAELLATIELFSNSGNEEQKCLLPARYKYLKKRGFKLAEFPKCEELEKFYDDLQPSGVTLLFTDAYMNNPSSLFGHTLMRIDTGRKGTQLLAHGVNYGAFTAGSENSVLFAVWGLTGGYFGGFTVKPYYDIINTYNNIENRDIWEFNLNLTPEELDFFVAHLWEIGHTQTRYYFFTQNCSYMLMETLDAVRPELRLADDFPAQSIPLDTIKAVYSRPGLVKSVNYRPSRQAKIRHRYRQMSAAEEEAYFKAIAEQDFSLDNLDGNAKADVSETAYQYVQYQYVAKELELSDYRKRSFKILTARNRLSDKGKMSELAEGHSPLLTHEAMRATAGWGVRNGEAFQEVSYRPAYHSLSDDNYGFLRGAEINFLNAVLRHYDNSHKTVLQEFDLVGIKSISPMDKMFQPISYAIDAKVERLMNPHTENEGYAFTLKVGGGASYALSDAVWVYGMFNNYAAYGGFLPQNQYLGIGAAAGIFADFGRWRLLAEAEKVWATDKIGSAVKYKVEAALTLTRNTALAAEYSYRQNYGRDIDEAVFSGRLYF